MTISTIRKWCSHIYLQYELSTCIYMFEPWEKFLINTVVLVMLSLFIFSSIVYLPAYMQTLITFLTPTRTIGDFYLSQPPAVSLKA